MSEVAINTWITGRSASRIPSQAALMSPVFARASPATATPRVRRAISLTAMRSPGEAAGKPASIMSTFSRTSCSATCIFSSVVIVAPGDCSPSRNVVSKIRITSGSSTSFFLLEIKKGVSVSNVILLTQQFLFSYLEHQPGHHRAQVAANVLDLVLSIAAAHGLEAGATSLVFEYPASSKRSILDFSQDLTHLIARALVDDAWP